MSMYLTTASVYRLNPPGPSPVAEDVPIAMTGCFACGALQVTPLLRPWTHVAEFPLDCDVRDSYPGQAGAWLLGNADTVKIPDTDGTKYVVIFVERYVNKDGHMVKRVYLDRLLPTYPDVEEGVE